MFLFSLFLFHFSFQHFFSLSSLLSLFTFSLHFFLSSLGAFSPIFFSLFSPFFLFSLSQCFPSLPSAPHVSPPVFLHRRFCVSSPCFFFIYVSVFCPNKFKNFLIFEQSFLLCFVACFSSLRRPYSLSLPCFTGFQRFLMFFFQIFLVSIFFSGLVQTFFAWLLDKICKKKKRFERNPCFS